MQQSVQKRARQQLSCTACRHGKLRCNRQQPCDQCLKRSKASSCTYLAPPEKKRKARNTKDRIAHLEGLVVQLMSQNSTGSSSSPGSQNDNERTRDSSSHSPAVSSDTSSKNGYTDHSYSSASITTGQLKVSNGETQYHGSAHWEAILEDIAGIKAELEDEEEEPSQENVQDPHTPLLVLGAPSPMSREALIQSVPAKPVVDRLLWHWFQSPDPSLPIIHRPTFVEEYDQFWGNPAETPTIWLAILFGIMSLGARLAKNKHDLGLQFIGGGDIPTDDPQHFQDLAACAIALADYTKPRKYTIEALFLYSSCEYMRQDDSQVRLWLFMAIVLRTALRMGYHRDSEHYPNVTPFEGEMRRRLWYGAYTFDILTSFQLGLPGIVLSVECDTKRPRNILDNDFGPKSATLPPSRPLSEVSPVTYVIVKSHLAEVFAKAGIVSNATHEPNYSDVMEIDEQLTRVHEDFPEALKFTSMNQSIADGPGLIFNRFKIELLYQKTRCVLHRRYLTEKLSDPLMEYSRKVCVEAAMQLLRHHAAVYEASQGSGPLSSTRWFMSSLNAHDFLLAAMILCLELNLIQKAPKISDAPGKPDAEKVEEMKRLLQRSYEIYRLPVRHYANTGKAVKVMELMLEKSGSLPKEPTSIPLHGEPTDLHAPTTNDNIVQPLGYLSIDQATAAPMLPSIDASEYAPIGGMFDVPQGLDWQSWDNYINEGNERLNLDLSLSDLDPNLFGNPANGGFNNGLSGVPQNSWF